MDTVYIKAITLSNICSISIISLLERILYMKNKVVDLLEQNIEGMSHDELSQLVEIPPKTEMGDFAFPCFRLAKIYRKAPQMIAQDLKEKIGTADFLNKIDIIKINNKKNRKEGIHSVQVI